MKTNRKTVVRLAALVLLVLVALTALTGCSNGNVVNASGLPDSLTAIQKSDPGDGLSASELDDVAKMLKETYTADFDTREMLAAAALGNDLVNDTHISDGTADPAAVVKKLVEKANAGAKDKALTASAYARVQEKLTAEDVTLLVGAFKTTVSLEQDGNWLDKILYGIGIGLGWITNTLGFGSYLIGICIFAVVIEIVMIPFAIKQQKNSIRQAQLRPKEMAIRNKYKGRNDQPTMQKMQAELQELYQRENFSPYSGCLPLLIQLPIIIVLYNIVINPLHYVLGQASTMASNLLLYFTTAKEAGGLGLDLGNKVSGTIQLLTHINPENVEGIKNFQFFANGPEVYEKVSNLTVPNFNIGNINFAMTPGFSTEAFSNGLWVLLLVPVLTFVTYFLTSKLTRKFSYQPAVAADDRQTACSNSMMDVTMPLMSTFFTFMVPAVIGVYWIFRSWLGLLKSFIMSKAMPLPKFTEDDYKAAAREMAGKKPVIKSANAGMVRSLHHIDDEDYDDTRDQALARKAKMEELERKKAEEAAQAPKQNITLFGLNPVKKDRKKTAKKQESKPDATENADGASGTEQNDETENTKD